MFRSKPIKMDDIKLTWLEKLSIHPAFEWWFDIKRKIDSTIHRLKRSWAYAKLGYNNWDFDAITIEHYLLFKLKRVQDCLINGHVDYSVGEGPKQLKALKLCIKLLERLNQGDMGYNRFMDLHDKKWGESKHWFEEVESDKPHQGSYLRTSRPNANTEAEKEQERKEFLEAAMADDRQQDRDRQIVYAIINKYIRTWWD